MQLLYRAAAAAAAAVRLTLTSCCTAKCGMMSGGSVLLVPSPAAEASLARMALSASRSRCGSAPGANTWPKWHHETRELSAGLYMKERTASAAAPEKTAGVQHSGPQPAPLHPASSAAASTNHPLVATRLLHTPCHLPTDSEWLTHTFDRCLHDRCWQRHELHGYLLPCPPLQQPLSCW